MFEMFKNTLNPINLQAGLRPNSAGIPYKLLLRIEAMGFPTFGLLLYIPKPCCKPPSSWFVRYKLVSSPASGSNTFNITDRIHSGGLKLRFSTLFKP